MDARLSPDRIDSATNRAIMDMFEEGFTLSDPKANNNEQSHKESFNQGKIRIHFMDSMLENKGKPESNRRYKHQEGTKKGDDSSIYQSGMYPPMGYM